MKISLLFLSVVITLSAQTPAPAIPTPRPAAEVVPALATQPASLTVTGSILSQNDISSLFGPLNSTYGGVRVDMCSDSSNNLTIPAAKIRQSIKAADGIVVLSDIEALSIIAKAQSNTAKAKILRGTVLAVELTALGSTWSRLSAGVKQTLSSAAATGAAGVQIVESLPLPACQLHFASCPSNLADHAKRMHSNLYSAC